MDQFGPLMPSRPFRVCLATSEQSELALPHLQRRFQAADRRWTEADTIRRLIQPILTDTLGYADEDLHSTVDPTVSYAGRTLLPDFTYKPKSGANSRTIIEAKRISVNIYSPKHGGEVGFANAIDQTLTYLDGFGTDLAILSNGWDWWLFRGEVLNAYGRGYSEYIGLHVRLDVSTARSETDAVSWFMTIFHRASVVELGDDLLSLPLPVVRQWPRALYGSKCLIQFHHFTDLPLKGRGSGFRFEI